MFHTYTQTHVTPDIIQKFPVAINTSIRHPKNAAIFHPRVGPRALKIGGPVSASIVCCAQRPDVLTDGFMRVLSYPSKENTVGVVTRLGAGHPRDCVSISGRNNVRTSSGIHLTSYETGNGGSVPWP
jgi:hypothetical protein